MLHPFEIIVTDENGELTYVTACQEHARQVAADQDCKLTGDFRPAEEWASCPLCPSE